jgi:hypothetical protein
MPALTESARDVRMRKAQTENDAGSADQPEFIRDNVSSRAAIGERLCAGSRGALK